LSFATSNTKDWVVKNVINIVAYFRLTKTPRKIIIVRQRHFKFFYMEVRCGHSEGRIQAECVREYGAERYIWGLRGIR